MIKKNILLLGVLLGIILSLGISSAAEGVDNHSKIMGSAGNVGATEWTGTIFKPNFNFTFMNTSKPSDSTATRVRLVVNGTDEHLGNVSFLSSATNIDFSSLAINLSNTTTYRLEWNDPAGSWSHRCNTSMTYPVSNYSINWVNGYLNTQPAQSWGTYFCNTLTIGWKTIATISTENTVNLNDPVNNKVIPNANYTFNGSMIASSIMNKSNASLYIWDNSGNLVNKTTIQINGTFNYTLFNGTIPQTLGRYNWNILGCFANSSTTECKFASSNYTFYNYISLNMRDNNGNHVAGNVNITCSAISLSTIQSSPYQTGLTTFTLGADSRNVTCTYTDINSYYDSKTIGINFSTLQTDYNISMSGRRITLNFFKYSGTDVNVTGFWSDVNNTGANFTGTNFTRILRDSGQGVVNVRFGFNISTVYNYSQFYEFENDWVTNTIENLTVLEVTDNSIYIKVIDEYGNPIEDALVKTSMFKPESGTTYKTIGQRFTGEVDVGMTYFIVDSSSILSMIVSKEGYTAVTSPPVDAGLTYTKSDPYVIVLRKGENNVHKGVSIKTWSLYNNETTAIPVNIYAPSRQTVTYTTNYRISNGFTNKTASLTEYKTASEILIQGTDYCSTCTTDLMLHFWIDGDYWGNLTIKYKSDAAKLDEPIGLETETKIRLLWLGLIFIVGLLGLIFKKEGENVGSGDTGKNLFMAGMFVLGIIFVTELWGLLVVTILYAILVKMRKVVAE